MMSYAVTQPFLPLSPAHSSTAAKSPTAKSSDPLDKERFPTFEVEPKL